MKINNIQGTNFGSLKTTSNAKIFMQKHLFPQDYKVLNEAAEKLSKTKFWDLEITSIGFKISSRNTKDAFIKDFLIKNIDDSTMMIESKYDGYAPKVEQGKPCRFLLEFDNHEEACELYSKMKNSSFLQKVILILEKLEQQSAKKYNKNPEVDADSTIVIDTWLDKILRRLFDEY